MMFVRIGVVATALALVGCAVELDLDEGPILEDLFGGDPYEVDEDALADLPERFVILAAEEGDADAQTICSWLIARLQRSCDVVRSQGDRLDFQRAAATPGMLIIGSPEAIGDFPRFRAVRWRDVNGFLFITRRFDGVLSDAAMRRRSLAAGDAAQSVAESLIAAAGLTESDFELLIGLGDLRARPRRFALTGDLCDGDFDVIAAPSIWATTRAATTTQPLGLECPLDLLRIGEDTFASLLDARTDLDRRAVDETLLAELNLSGEGYDMIVHARGVLYANLMTPRAEDAFRRALTVPLENPWRDEGVQRHRDRRAGLRDE